MSSRLEMSEDSQSRVMNKFCSFVDDVLATSASGTEFQGKVEESVANARIAREPDGVSLIDTSDEVSYNEKRKEYHELYERWGNSTGKEADELADKLIALENEFPELQYDKFTDDIYKNMPPEQAQQKAVDLCKREILENKKQADKAYFKVSEDKKPPTKEQIFNSFGTDINLNDLGRKIINNTKEMLSREPKAYHEECKKAAQKEWADTDKVAYRKNTYESNGKTVEYTEAAQKVDWGRLIANKSSSVHDNLERLRDFVSRQIFDYFGGFKRITSIVVRSQQLIINNVCYTPIIDPKFVKDASVFPLDSLDYIRNGYIAPLFNWKHLRRMTRLTLLDIDDTNFYLNDIASDIGAGRRAGLTTIFNLIPSLQTFILGGDVVNEDEVNTEQGRKVKEKIAKHKHFMNFSDGYQFNVYNGTNGLQNWTMNNLKNFANNRGNRGIFRFSAGLVGRGVIAGVAGAINLGVHLIGGAFKAGKKIIHDATTDVTEEDMQ